MKEHFTLYSLFVIFHGSCRKVSIQLAMAVANKSFYNLLWQLPTSFITTCHGSCQHVLLQLAMAAANKYHYNIHQVQKPAPNFTAQAVVNGQFKEVSLSDYQGKYVVVYFYPLDFTFVCPTEIIAFSDRIKEFADINCEVSDEVVVLFN